MATLMTSREFNQRVGDAKRAAEKNPVVVTNRGVPSHVLLTWRQYQRLQGHPAETIAEALAPAEELADSLAAIPDDVFSRSDDTPREIELA